MTNVLITGGSGLIGSSLSKKLREKGYAVAHLSRVKNNKTSIPTFTWDYLNNTMENEAINFADYIIHLAGTNIGDKRWTRKRKKEILESRVKSGELLLNSILDQNKKLKAFITASAVGYYGLVTSDKIFSEADKSFDDFVGNTCKAWEQQADKFQTKGIRTVKLRTGIVLTKKRGAFAKMIFPLKFRIAAILGNGKQYLPWIHVDDLCNIYIKAIEDLEMKGAYNAVAPEHLSYKSFIKKLTVLYQRRFLNVKTPSVFLKIIFGKMSKIILEGSRVSSKKIVEAGFEFKYPSIQSALTDLLPAILKKEPHH